MEDPNHHALVVGRTGIGESTALRKLFRQQSLAIIECPTVFVGPSLEASIEAFLLKLPNGVHYWKGGRLATFKRERIVFILRKLSERH